MAKKAKKPGKEKAPVKGNKTDKKAAFAEMVKKRRKKKS